MGQGARIYAFEPNPESFRCAMMALSLHGIENVDLMCAGLGATPGTGVMQTYYRDGSARGGSRRILPRSDADLQGLTIQIPMTTIDETVPRDRTVTVIRLDLEGYGQTGARGGRWRRFADAGR